MNTGPGCYADTRIKAIRHADTPHPAALLLTLAATPGFAAATFWR